MHQHGGGGSTSVDTGQRRIILVGNPNVGKSVIFGILTGRYVTVSNYPGTTVEMTQGNATVNGAPCLVLDTPGVNSLIPMSEDEQVTRDILMTGGDRAVLQVADAKNLRRSLLISLQLAEMGLPFVIGLNMDDEARSRGIHIDVAALSETLGVPVTSTVATQRTGVGALTASLDRAAVSAYQIDYGSEIEAAAEQVAPLLPETGVSHRSAALMLLAGDESLTGWLRASVPSAEIAVIETILAATRRRFNHPLGYIIGRARLTAVDALVEQTVRQEKRIRNTWADTLGRLSMHWVWGVPILLVVLYLTYLVVGVFAADTCVGFLEGTVFGATAESTDDGVAHGWLIPFLDEQVITKVLGRTGAGGLVRDFLIGPFGIISMALTYAIALILPIVTFFFLIFGLLEDSGYMPRLAVMMNKWFKMIGLNGKAVLPMLLGLGCDTMATLTARILPSRKERILVTLLLALGVPCSAQLGVQGAILANISAAALLIWIGLIIVILFVVGWIAARVVPGRSSDFVLEVPPIRIPKLSNIVIKTLARVEWYLKEAVPLFIYGTILLFLLATIPAGNGLTLLEAVEKMGEPVVSGLLGLPPEAAPAFVLGFLRRDYGVVFAAGQDLTPNQTLVAAVTLTLFIPCIANLLIMIKERGMKVTLWMVAFIIPFAFLVGGAVNLVLTLTGVEL